MFDDFGSAFYSDDCLSQVKAMAISEQSVNEYETKEFFEECQQTRLHIACEHYHRYVIDYLLNLGADPSLPEKILRKNVHHLKPTIAILCGARSRNFDGAQIDEQDLLTSLTLLCEAYSPSDFDLGEALIAAAHYQRLTLVQYLLSIGAQGRYVNKEGCNALHEIWVSENDQQIATELTRTLLQAGASANQRQISSWQRTPLIWAASNCSLECVELLLAAGADVNDQDRDGHSAMDFAIERGAEAVVNALNNAGAALSHDQQQVLSLNKAIISEDLDALVSLASSLADSLVTFERKLILSQACSQMQSHTLARQWALAALSEKNNAESSARLIAASCYAGRPEQAIEDYQRLFSGMDLQEAGNYFLANLIFAAVELNDTALCKVLIKAAGNERTDQGADLLYFNIGAFYAYTNQLKQSFRAACQSRVLGKTVESFLQDRHYLAVLKTPLFQQMLELSSPEEASVCFDGDGIWTELVMFRGDYLEFQWPDGPLIEKTFKAGAKLLEHYITRACELSALSEDQVSVESPAIELNVRMIIEELNQLAKSQVEEHTRGKIACLSCEWDFADEPNQRRWWFGAHHCAEEELSIEHFSKMMFSDDVVWEDSNEEAALWGLDAWKVVCERVEQRFDWNRLNTTDRFYLQFQEHDCGYFHVHEIKT